TRIIKPDGLDTKNCLDFINEFHTKAIQNQDNDFLSALIEPNPEEDNSTLQKVNIHSELKQITWGRLAPEVIGEIQWNMKETNPGYTSVQLLYQVRVNGTAGEKAICNVEEFLRVYSKQGKMYLLDYDRTMNQIFDGTGNAISEKGVNLGISSPEIPYQTNQDGTIVSFVQERELWTYNKEADEISLVFSFANAEGEDIRNRYNQHEVKIINMDKNGNVTFAVYGYMNRGIHEGKSGVAIYYFNMTKNSVEEKAFIPSNESYGIAKNDLEKLVYYSQTSQALYVMIERTLYRVDLATSQQEVVIKELQKGQYVTSQDGGLLAYQNNGSLLEATSVTVLNLENGITYPIDASPDHTISGENTLPMYKIEIRDSKNELAKTYQIDQVYTLDAFVNGNMITLNRATKSGDVYTGIAQDYITNNQKKEDGNISLETYTTEEQEQQVRLKYQDGIKDHNPKVLKPKQVLLEEPLTVVFERKDKGEQFYVYAKGTLAGIYDKAGYAVQAAENLDGIVTSSKQDYVWEKGNRNLRYEIPNIEGYTIATGENTLPETIHRWIEEGKAIDFTGCTLEQILYVISHGKPVIGMKDSQNAILLVGYEPSTITYVDLATGIKDTTSVENIAAMTAGSGNTFIGLVSQPENPVPVP
ncbi:MAG: hypothetical protein RR369_02940, partial [Lachnospiraceae bacterium]